MAKSGQRGVEEHSKIAAGVEKETQVFALGSSYCHIGSFILCVCKLSGKL
jgi:hypothetical protein